MISLCHFKSVHPCSLIRLYTQTSSPHHGIPKDDNGHFQIRKIDYSIYEIKLVKIIIIVYHSWCFSISIDDTEVLNVTPQTNMWEFGELDKDGVENPWAAGTKMAPFDQEVKCLFFFTLKLTVPFCLLAVRRRTLP